MHALEQVPGRYLPVAADAKRDQDGNQRKNRDGVPQWSITTLHTPPQGKPEVITITVTSAESPELTPMQPVGLMQEQVTSSVASREGWPGRMSSCPSRFPRSSVTTWSASQRIAIRK